MIIRDSQELIDETYTWLIQRIDELRGGPRTAGIHLTELIYCLTSGYWDRLNPLPITRNQALIMGMGIAMERLLIPPDKRAAGGTKDGIEYSPDFWFKGNMPSELKTTRMSTKKTITREFPETWMQQIKGYCYAEGKLEYGLSIVHLMGGYKPPFPEILAVEMVFTQQELQQQWDYLLWRKENYIKAFADQEPPTPTRFCQDWECKDCRYNVVTHCGNYIK